ncbi:MAG: LytTR family transcriptional regulator DNA-binding domain-containing protein [Cyclobacteriaceae bacterium]
MWPKAYVHDRWLFMFVYPIMGVSFVHIGNDNSFGKLITIPSYYSDIILALAVTYLVGFYIRWISRRMEARFDWETQPRPRLVYQFIYGLLIPTLFAMSVELIYLSLLGIPVGESSIFYLELPVAVGFLILINLIYFILYSRLHTSALKTALVEQAKERSTPQEKYLIATQGKQKIRVPDSSIAYFMVRDKLTFLVTADNRRLLYDKPMKEVMDMLPEKQYYRLNRQLIASRSSIVRFTPTKTRRLQIELSPPADEEVFLAKVKATDFITWLEGN